MRCPHCHVTIHPDFDNSTIYREGGEKFVAKNTAGFPSSWELECMVCPACAKGVIQLVEIVYAAGTAPKRSKLLVLPRAATRPSAPPEVPAELASDFNEACLVLADSPKASAALSRRCLQGILRSNGYTHKDLAPAIDAVLNSNTLPSTLADSLDAIRNVGNFAAHPMKDTNTGTVLPVEDHEAEWNLDVLEDLFDFYYVAPEKARQKKAALNAKLAAANKPPMK